MAPPKTTGPRKSTRASSRASTGAVKVKARNVKSEILKRIASEVEKTPRTAARRRGPDTHIKTDTTDLHGKGHHIKGAGPNYLKDA
jgi:hypothetical protein